MSHKLVKCNDTDEESYGSSSGLKEGGTGSKFCLLKF